MSIHERARLTAVPTSPNIHEPPRFAFAILVSHDGAAPTVHPAAKWPGAARFPDARPAWERGADAVDSRYDRHPHRNLDTWDVAEQDRLARCAPSGSVLDIDAIRRRLCGVERRAGSPETVYGALVATAAMLMFGISADELLRRRGVRRQDASTGPRARFSGLAAVLSAAKSTPMLGMGSMYRSTDDGPVLPIAESTGRTRSGWGEVSCRESRSGTARAKGIGGLERRIDAMGVRGVDIDSVIARAIDAKVRSGETWADVIAGYRIALAEQRMVRRRPSVVTSLVEAEEVAARAALDTAKVAIYVDKSARRRAVHDAAKLADEAKVRLARWERNDETTYRNAVREATRDITDDAIRDEITRARKAMETRLRVIPPNGIELAVATGDLSFAGTLIPPAGQRGRRRERQPTENIAIEPRIMGGLE